MSGALLQCGEERVGYALSSLQPRTTTPPRPQAQGGTTKNFRLKQRRRGLEESDQISLPHGPDPCLPSLPRLG